MECIGHVVMSCSEKFSNLTELIRNMWWKTTCESQFMTNKIKWILTHESIEPVWTMVLMLVNLYILSPEIISGVATDSSHDATYPQEAL